MTQSTFKPLIRAGIFLGIGMGGFFDGIVFHQLLQLHNMLTGKLPKDSITNIEVNMFWDGLFHAGTWTGKKDEALMAAAHAVPGSP